ncbi:sulfur carrier protein ThiS [Rouxiella sp. Mn2063]|uniref:sulfur carrier protein ThiS n=1 Tax=Rouxiella sp. Mn2063 TaxID=3395262 RepID=UPI003BC21BE4
MKIRVNDIDHDFPGPLTLENLLEHLNHAQAGSALAVNQAIVPRPNWANYLLQDGDQILLFQAIAGG